ncbi:hypothetical protein OUZ56_003169 [Daphnia magna]|uniref:Reverse transcriptase domain-containing protein n=1 Tax=Daphnia magna TaxID=35525 RepID=A0ABR0A8D8_9CRUS|nr:hypothetical protein OUZ56_003169 [Daphnia magna]
MEWSFLKPFAEITRVAEGSTYPTLGFAVPLFNSLMIVLDSYAEEKDDFVHDFRIIEAARSANLKLKVYYNKLKLEYFKDNQWDSEIQDRLLPMIKESWADYRPRITMTLSANRRPDD